QLQPRHRTLLALELSSPLDGYPARQRHLRCDAGARLVDERAEVTAADVHADANVAVAVLATDRRPTLPDRYPRQGLERHGHSSLDRHLQLADLLDVVACRRRVAQDDAVPGLAVPKNSYRLTAQRRL